MACDLTAGRALPCKDSIGGLDAVYFINYDEITGYTYDATNTDVIDTITGGGTINAYKYDLKGNSNVEETITSSRENGTTFFSAAINLTFTKQDIETNKEIKLMSWGRPRVITKDHNGNFKLYGLEFGADVSGGTIVSGSAMGDLNGYTLTLTAEEKIPANFLVATDEAGLATMGLTIVAG